MLLVFTVPAFEDAKLIEAIPTTIQCLSVYLKVLFRLPYAILKGGLVHLIDNGISK